MSSREAEPERPPMSNLLTQAEVQRLVLATNTTGDHAMLCEIQELVTYTDEHPTPDAPGVLATARAFVRFSNGDEANFDVCEACARRMEQDASTDARLGRVTIVHGIAG